MIGRCCLTEGGLRQHPGRDCSRGARADRQRREGAETGRHPGGNDGASETYVASKIRNCGLVGFDSAVERYDASISEQFLLERISLLNDDPGIDGILVQLPLPKHISVQKVTEAIRPEKDVDGFHPVNVGRMVQNLPCFYLRHLTVFCSCCNITGSVRRVCIALSWGGAISSVCRPASSFTKC